MQSIQTKPIKQQTARLIQDVGKYKGAKMI